MSFAQPPRCLLVWSVGDMQRPCPDMSQMVRISGKRYIEKGFPAKSLFRFCRTTASPSHEMSCNIGGAIANFLVALDGGRQFFMSFWDAFSFRGVPPERSGTPPAPPKTAGSNFEWIWAASRHRFGTRRDTLGTLWRHRCGPGGAKSAKKDAPVAKRTREPVFRANPDPPESAKCV